MDWFCPKSLYVNTFGSNGQRHAVLDLMECLLLALHKGSCFERIDWEIGEKYVEIYI